MDIDLSKIEELANLIDRNLRATNLSVKNFIEPAEGTLNKATNKQHNLIFGRRGSGKTSLLLKAAFDLESKEQPNAYIDLEPYKGQIYPDVLISILLETLSKYDGWIKLNKIEKKRRMNRLFINIRKIFSEESRRLLALENEISTLRSELNELLSKVDFSEVKTSQKSGLEGNRDSSAKIGTTALAGSEFSVQGGVSTKSWNESEESETYKRSKVDYLNKSVPRFRKIFSDLSQLTNVDSYLFFDDLYHIPKREQAQLLDFFHRVAKNNRVWLKIGTIKHRSEWYIHSTTPIGLKLGDDAVEINLDLTLESYSLTKDFLVQILTNFIDQCGAPRLSDFMTFGAIDRLVLASGGVARDFLGIFLQTISVTRERCKTNKENFRIEAVDVNQASGMYGEYKFEELKRDTLEDTQAIQTEFTRVKEFCLENTNTNCFLVDQDLSDGTLAMIDELVDLRLVHSAKSRLTISGRPRKIFRAYLLDISQYTGERKRRGLNMIEFWKSTNREELRKVTLIYPPQ